MSTVGNCAFIFLHSFTFPKVNLFACFLRVRQETGYDAEEWQEGTYLEDELDAGLVGEPSEEGGAQAAQAEHQSEEDAGNQSHLVGHQVGGINYDG